MSDTGFDIASSTMRLCDLLPNATFMSVVLGKLNRLLTWFHMLGFPRRSLHAAHTLCDSKEVLTILTMINKILVAIDSSNTDKTIFNQAVALAKATNASLIMLHVLSTEDPDYPILPTYAYYSVLEDSDGGVFQQKYTEYENRNIDLLKDLTRQAIAQGINAEFTQLSGDPGWEICDLASVWSADLIVVGSRGRGLQRLKEMFLGSVSNYVTHHAPCSVLIVRQPIDSELENNPSEPSENEELLASDF